MKESWDQPMKSNHLEGDKKNINEARKLNAVEFRVNYTSE